MNKYSKKNNNSIKISIALATYNGEKYIQDQLDSFFKQTIPPNELIVCDDISSDKTLELINKFRLLVSFPVKIYNNKKRLGYAQNFSKALSLCNGDLIFLSDQDDVWFPKKIETMIEIASNNPDKYLFYNDAEFTDQYLNKSGITKLDRIKKIKNNSLNSFIQGSCSLVRKTFIDDILPVPNEIDSHDVWIGRLARYCDLQLISPITLQYYRQHSENCSNNIINNYNQNHYHYMYNSLSKNSLLNSLIINLNALQLYKHKINQLLVQECKNIDNNYLINACSNIDHEIEIIKKRIYLKKRSLIPRIYMAILYLLNGKYRNFNGLYSFCKDIILNSY